jgi:hypothetical protein
MHVPQLDSIPPRPGRSSRQRGPILALLLAVSALGLGGCAAAASSIPSLAVPSNVVPTTNGSASPVAACADPATMAVITQLEAPGADVTGLLTTNKDVLITGLNTLQPADAATTAWRDALVKALQDGDMATASAKIGELTSGGVTLSAC